MILIKISNSSEIIASKVGQFIEKLTPDNIDNSTVEDQVIKKMIESLSKEGLKGEITAINGIEVSEESIIINEGISIRNKKEF